MSKETIQQDVEDEKREYVDPPFQVEDKEEDEKRPVDSVEPPEEEELSERDRIAKKYQEREYGEGDEEPEQEPEPEPDEVEVKVNGRTRMVPREKVEAAGGIDVYQKRLAAEEGMQTVADERKRLQQERQEFQQWQQEQMQKLQTQQQPPPVQGGASARQSPPEGDSKILAQQYREALYDGDDDKADEIFAKMAAKGTQQQAAIPDPDQIAAQAVERFRKEMQKEQYEKEVAKGQQMFEEKFSDIAQDPRLYDMANAETIRLQQEHPDWSPVQIIEEAGTRIQQWAGSRGMAATKDKVERKRAMNIPRTASGRFGQAPEPQPESNSDYVSRLRKQRTGHS